MSMTLEEAIEELERLLSHWDELENGKRSFRWYSKDAVGLALTALRPVSRGQVEKVWEKCQHSRVCGTCKVCVGGRYQQANFCAACGAPLTDEAVEMVMERLKVLHGETD